MAIFTGERELIHAARQGDLEAFNRLILAYQDELFTLVYWLAPPDVDAEALTQRVVWRIYRELPRYRSGEFRIWVLNLLVGVCRGVPRSMISKVGGESSRGKNGRLSSQSRPSQAEKRGRDGQIRIETPEGNILNRLSDLPFELRLVAALVDIQGLDYEEAAEVLGTTPGEIRGRLAKARHYLCQFNPDGFQFKEIMD